MTILNIGSAALRLAKYLKEFVSLRTTTVRDVAKYESVLWFGDMPQEPDCRSPAWTDDHEPGTPWLEVKKQQFEKAPSPPEVTLPWLDEKALAHATPIIAALRSSIQLPDLEAELADGEGPPLVAHSIHDHPEVQQAYERYRPAWEAWSTEFRRREAIQAIYAELFSLHTQVRKQGEIIEVVLGLGLLDWRQKINDGVVRVRRHCVVAHVELEFKPAEGLIRVVPPNDGARLQIEDDMLDTQYRPDRMHYATVTEQLKEVGDDIWDKARTYTALKVWAGALSANSKWSPSLGAASATANDPVMSFAPALIVRKRTQTGMVRIYQALIEQLSDEAATVPQGWGGLTTDENVPPGPGKEEPSQDPKAITEVYFPLQANREQRQIVEAIEREQGVLVQGPPGTGKSHTIANLICHLLATGKRVLITAETSRALQVLRGKLPLEVQPLCISLLGQGGEALTELNKAVQGITTRQAAYTPGAYDKRIAEVDHELDLARRQLAKTDSEIRSLREEETHSHQVADGTYSGSASAIAERVANESISYAWLRLPADAKGVPPLANRDAIQWLEIRRRYTDAKIVESRLRTPSISGISEPRKFAEAVAAERSALCVVAQTEQLRGHVAYSPISALSTEARDQLRSDLQKIERQRLSFIHMRGKWQQNAAPDLVAGRRARWDALLSQTQKQLIRGEYLLEKVGSRQVTLPESHDPRRVRADAEVALLHFSNGGKWKKLGFITPKPLAGLGYLRRDVLVDGRPASDSEGLQIVCDHLQLESVLADLHSAWRTVGALPVSGDRLMRLAQFKERLSVLQLHIEFANACQQIEQVMRAAMPPIPEPDWLNGQVSEYLKLTDAAAEEERSRDATQIVNSALRDLRILCTLPDAHPVCRAMCSAIEARDVKGYSTAYEHAESIAAACVDQQRRIDIEATLDTSAPGLTENVGMSIDDPTWGERLSSWEQAWHWCIADRWLRRRSSVGYQQKLWKRRHEIDLEIGQLLAEAVSLRAWTHFFSRLLPPQSAALKGWRETVRAMGKGKGQSAKLAHLREEARKYMDVCRDAIPVWIMPRYLVAEMIDPAPNRYDIVIVDEASQLGIESLFLFYISKKMVVVGDDQQISPYGIGIDNDAIAGLQDQYLEGIPHQGSLSAQSSLYGNAKIRFSKNVVLREHFRCMPEIIQFSNDLCYANNGTPLDPLRAYPANRLQPLVVRHVADGYRSGGSQNAQNIPEADAIVAQIVSCIDDPRYERATMGVISLQGDTQAKLIERKLLEHLDPAIIEAKRLICGDAYAFQGDERDIIFLSMVAAPGEKRIGVLSTESARQRFNVAVSRARDQLWLFHSATLDVLSDACMRHRLLSYMLNPARQPSPGEGEHFDSEFERAVYWRITARGFHVRTQVCIGDPVNHRYRIDLVVEGMQGRLAVECDGEKWHGPERYEHDMARQRDLERAGWQFVRIRGGDFYRDADTAMQSLWAELDRLGIKPGGIDEAAAVPPPPICPDTLTESGAGIGEPAGNEPPQADDEPEIVRFSAPTPAPPISNDKSGTFAPEPEAGAQKREAAQPSQDPTLAPKHEQEPRSVSIDVSDKNNPVNRTAYLKFEGEPGPDPRNADASKVSLGLRRVIEVEGPMVAKRAYDIYLRGCGIRRMGGELRRLMDKGLQHAIRNGDVFAENELGQGSLSHWVVRAQNAPLVLVRERGPREFEEIPPSELQLAARRLVRGRGLEPGSDVHLREVLDFFELKRLTAQVATTLRDVYSRKYSYVDQILEREI